MTKTVLVLGATGGVGGAVAEAMARNGWRVRALHRDPEAARRRAGALDGIEWIAGDAMDRDAIVAAAQGAQAIFHGLNPPKYRNWRGLAMPMLANSIEAARQSGARLLFPGNVYNYGPDAGAVVRESAPQNPRTRKGAIRVEMEAILAAASREGVRSITLRAGDYLGAGAPSSWFQTAMVKPGRPVAAVAYPGEREVGHSWAYLPDLGEAFARLADREGELGPCETFHFEGQWLERGVEIAESVRRIVGRPDLPIRRFPWPVVYLLAPAVELFRELIEMRYLWRTPLRLDNAKLVAFLGEEPHTPLDAAVRATLAGLGCLDSPAVTAPPLAKRAPTP